MSGVYLALGGFLTFAAVEIVKINKEYKKHPEYGSFFHTLRHRYWMYNVKFISPGVGADSIQSKYIPPNVMESIQHKLTSSYKITDYIFAKESGGNGNNKDLYGFSEVSAKCDECGKLAIVHPYDLQYPEDMIHVPELKNLLPEVSFPQPWFIKEIKIR